MKPSPRSSYKVTCFADEDKVIALVTFDKKNSSIHLHFYSEIFGSKRAKIQVRHAEENFPDTKDADLIQQVVPEYSPVPGLQVKSITKLKDTEASTREGEPVRIIVRFAR